MDVCARCEKYMTDYIYIPVPEEYYDDVIKLIIRKSKTTKQPVNPQYTYSKYELVRAREMQEQGATIREIAKAVGWPVSTTFRRLRDG